MKKFVIISTQRSGSTLLVKALDKHPDIFMVGELFKENNIDVIHNFSDNLLRNNINTNKYLQKCIFKTRLSRFEKLSATKDVSAFGFKLMINQIKFIPGILKYLSNQGYSFIILKRDDLLDIAISLFFAKRQNLYVSEKEIDISNSVIPIDWYTRTYKKLNLINKKLDNVGNNFSKSEQISYESLVSDWKNQLDTIFNHLELDNFDIKMQLKKIIKNKKSVVTNYEQLQELSRLLS